VATITKILVPTDFSEDSARALEYAEELARKFGAEIVMIHVDQPLAPVIIAPEFGSGFDMGAVSRLAEEQRLRRSANLTRLRPDCVKLVSNRAACSRSALRFWRF